jgi:DNA polymerase III sliding clamp (beta) subunit (PCNA family)
MLRIELIDKLALAAPALAKTSFVEMLSKFWFDGKRVIAHNDQIAICVPLKTAFKGAVDGDLLLGLLRSSATKQADFSVTDAEAMQLVINAGATKMKLPLYPETAFIWDPPIPKPAKQIKLTKEHEVHGLLHAISRVMLSVSGDTTIPDHLGITFVPEADGVALFSTNDASLSYSYVELPQDWPLRVILPTLFCEQLVSLGGKRKDIALEVYRDHVLAVITDHGETKDPILLFSRVIETERPHNFMKTFKAHYTKAAKEIMLPLPSDLNMIAERAFIVSQAKKGVRPTNLSVKAGELTVLTDGSGLVNDKLELKDHPDVSLDIEVKFLCEALGAYHSSLKKENGNFCVTPECLIINHGDSVYLLAEKKSQAKKK